MMYLDVRWGSEQVAHKLQLYLVDFLECAEVAQYIRVMSLL